MKNKDVTFWAKSFLGKTRGFVLTENIWNQRQTTSEKKSVTTITSVFAEYLKNRSLSDEQRNKCGNNFLPNNVYKYLSAKICPVPHDLHFLLYSHLSVFKPKMQPADHHASLKYFGVKELMPFCNLRMSWKNPKATSKHWKCLKKKLILLLEIFTFFVS